MEISQPGRSANITARQPVIQGKSMKKYGIMDAYTKRGRKIVPVIFVHSSNAMAIRQSAKFR